MHNQVNPKKYRRGGNFKKGIMAGHSVKCTTQNAKCRNSKCNQPLRAIVSWNYVITPWDKTEIY